MKSLFVRRLDPRDGRMPDIVMSLRCPSLQVAAAMGLEARMNPPDRYRFKSLAIEGMPDKGRRRTLRVTFSRTDSPSTLRVPIPKLREHFAPLWAYAQAQARARPSDPSDELPRDPNSSARSESASDSPTQ